MYFDAAASTPIAPDVQKVMDRVSAFGNPYSKHAEGHRAFKILKQSLESMADVLGVSPDQLVITHGGTDGNRKVLWELQGDNVEMDVELIVTIAMEDRLRFAIREGGRTVGAGIVAQIIE